jgi:predicted aspartyl protease
MGTFRVDCEVRNVRTEKKAIVKGLLVDTGAELTWLPQEVLAGIGTTIAKKDQQFIMANGQTITRSIGYVILRAGGFETVDEAVFGQPGDMAILGSHTLEGFGATVDPRRKKLVVAGPYPAAKAC